MDETEDTGPRGEFLQSFDDGEVCCQISVEFAGLDVEHIDKDPNISKDVGFL